jgi:tetratricopeptide (TPR) repeat protein
MKLDLPETALATLKQNSKTGRDAWKNGDVLAAETHFLNAWAAIPEPKNTYDYAQSLASGLVVFYRDTKQNEKAKKWLEIMRQTYSSPTDDYVEFTAATIHFEMGELDLAFVIFDKQFKKFKNRPFEGEDKKYLEFYKKRAAGG